MKKSNRRISVQSRKKFLSALIFTGLVAAGTTINGLVEHGMNFYPVLSEFLIGVIFGTIVSVFEIYYFEPRLRRFNFYTSVLIRTIFYLSVSVFIIIAIAASRVGYEADIQYYEALNHDDLSDYIKSSEFIELLIFTLVLIVTVNFIRQVSRLLGPKVLFHYVTGRYQPPIREEIIVMFLDLNSSTTIAEKLGLLNNHHFLNDFFHDMTDSILECKGKVHQYVGDEIVIMWTLKDGCEHMNCVRCFFLIEEAINKNQDRYIQKYGINPGFKAGLHCGSVIAGEMGDLKKDIVFHGDTMNTAARIEAECHTYKKKFLASSAIINAAGIDKGYRTEFMGSILLRGKEKPLDIFSIEE